MSDNKKLLPCCQYHEKKWYKDEHHQLHWYGCKQHPISPATKVILKLKQSNIKAQANDRKWNHLC